jgi:hypothetical protein
MSEKLPTSVTLPDIATYTSDIIFGNLGLPVGFDEERLVVSLRSIERVRSIAGLGTLSIAAERGETRDFDYSSVGVSPSGAAFLGAYRKQPKKPLSRTDIHFPLGSGYDQPAVSITISNTEAEERIYDQGDRYERGVFSPEARARFMHASIKKGLREASLMANFDLQKLRQATIYYGVLLGLSGLFGANEKKLIPATLLFGPVLKNISSAQMVIDYNLRKPKEEELGVRDTLKRLRQSFFVGPALDRIVMANAVISPGKLIKALS